MHQFNQIQGHIIIALSVVCCLGNIELHDMHLCEMQRKRGFLVWNICDKLLFAE